LINGGTPFSKAVGFERAKRGVEVALFPYSVAAKTEEGFEKAITRRVGSKRRQRVAGSLGGTCAPATYRGSRRRDVQNPNKHGGTAEKITSEYGVLARTQ